MVKTKTSPVDRKEIKNRRYSDKRNGDKKETDQPKYNIKVKYCTFDNRI